MAFHDHISQAMALQHYTDQQLTDNVAVLRGILPEQLGQSSSEAAGKSPQLAGPSWINSAILRQQSQHHQYGGDGSFLHLQTTNSDSSASNNQWLSRPIHGSENDDVPVSSESMMATTAMNNNNQEKKLGERQNESDCNGEESDWQNAKCKADILGHPLYDQLLSAHVSCLRIATPVDQLPRIDAQLAQSQHVVAKYSVLGHGNQPLDDKDLDQFMVTLSIYSLLDVNMSF